MSDANARPYPADSYPYQRGPEHPDWKGTAASYSAMHKRVYRARGRADHCSRADGNCAGRFEWANISGDYNNIWDYMQLCRAHHDEYDGAREKRQGERNGFAKLTEKTVREIRRRRLSGESVTLLALAFNVSRSSVYRVLSGDRWKWVS